MKIEKLDDRENPVYHDTELLLRKYRDVVWSLELSVQQVRRQFKLEYGSSIEEFLDTIYMAGFDLADSHIQEHTQSIERSYKMLKLIENAVNILRTKHKYGEVYYWLLYYTYLSPQKYRNVEEILEQLEAHDQVYCRRSYFNKRKEAINAFSSILWGYSSRECLSTLELFFPEE